MPLSGHAMSSTTQISPAGASRARVGLLLGLVGMVIFGGTLPATRLAVAAIDPVAVTAIRAALAGLCSLAVLVALRRPLPPAHTVAATRHRHGLRRHPVSATDGLRHADGRRLAWRR